MHTNQSAFLPSCALRPPPSSAVLLSPLRHPHANKYPASAAAARRPAVRQTSMPSASALCDRRVLCTIPPVYAPALSAALLSLQARPIHAPTVETQRLDDGDRTQLDTAVLRLSEYALVIFLSRSAVTVFTDVLLSLVENDIVAATTALRASGVRLAAMGRDAAAVRDMLDVPVDVVPMVSTPSGLVDALAADKGQWESKSVLVPVPVVRGMKEPCVVPDFLQALQDKVACQVCPCPAYVTTPVAENRLAVELELLRDARVDAVVICSTGEAYALRALLSEEEAEAFVQRVKDGRLVVAAHGPVTARGIRSVFPIDVVMSRDSSSFDGVALALDEHFVAQCKEEGRLVLPN